MKKKAIILTFSIILMITSLVVGLCSCDNDDNSSETTICQHEWVEVVQDSSLKTAATCETQAIYYKSCSKCGINGTETFKAGDYAEHTYASGEDVCSICKKIKDSTYSSYSSSKGYVYSESYNILYFGLYPQSLVLDSSVLSSLNISAGQLPTYTDFKNWTSYGFTEKGKTSEYIWYQDVTIGDLKYRGVYFVSYRPDKSTNDNTDIYSNQDNNGYYTSNVYWFKYEPIKWNIISRDGEEATVVSELALDAQYYNSDTSSIVSSIETIYASNYENSTIRAWLNDTFYSTAFSTLQKSLIIEQVVDNSTTSDSIDNQHAVAQKNTNDNVTLLSYQDIKNYATLNKVKAVTAYAQSLGAYSANSISKWWTRSASKSDGYSVYFVSYDGSLSTNEVNSTQISIVPTLKVRICTSDNPSGHDYAEIVSDAHLKSAATCTTPAIYYKSCTSCGAHSIETFEVGTALGHTIVEVQNVNYLKSEATCTSPAIYYKSCSVCGEKIEDETFEYGVALGHDYSKEYDVDATCEEKGYTAHECIRCGDVQKSAYTSVLGHIMDEVVDPMYLKTAATCDSPAIYYKSCTRKGCTCKSEETFEYGLKLGHNYVDIVAPQYLKSEATCTSRAIYYKSCTRCGCASDETFGYGNALGHVYDKYTVDPTCCEGGYSTYTCQRCSHTYISDYTYALGHDYDENNICTRCDKVNNSSIYTVDYDEGIAYFGSYPQTLVTSSTLISSLNEKAGVIPTQTDNGKWSAFAEYYLDGEEAIYMWYIDVELEIKTGTTTSFTEKYRGLYFTDYRDNNVTGSSTLGEEPWQSVNGYKINTTYWFRYDPIMWDIIQIKDGKLTLVSDFILDAQAYNTWTSNKTIENSRFDPAYPNDWETSAIRTWLNSTFYNAAFSSDETELIQDSEVANKRTYANSDYTTYDKVFLVAMSTVKVYKKTGMTEEEYLKGTGTGYALAQGLSTDNSDDEIQYSKYWARDPKTGNNYDCVNVIDVDGTSQYDNVAYSCIGVRPAVLIALNECKDGKHVYDEQIVYPDCTSEGYTESVCKYCGYTIRTNIVSATGHTYHDGMCTKCDAIDYDEINALFETKGYALNNSTLFFGKYPQTEVPESDSIYADLCNQAGSDPTKDNPGKWTSYGYYYKDSDSDALINDAFMWYYDTQYGGEWYRGVYFTAYRPNSSSRELDSADSYVEENGFIIKHVYWFKYEPIRWLVLESEDGYVTATTDLQIDATYYNQNKLETKINNETVYALDWENSYVREWLATTFYNTAFTSLQKTIIQSNFINNRTSELIAVSQDEKYLTSQNNTVDKIYLPSLYDVTTEYSTFNVDYTAVDYWRQNESSDYARIQGSYVYAGGDYDLNGYAMLRSPSGSSGASILSADFDGSIKSVSVDDVLGIVPMIRIKIQDCQNGSHTYIGDNGICNICGAVDETKLNNQLATKNCAVSDQYVYFGSYPQTLVTDTTLITALNSNYPYPGSGSDKWSSYGYLYCKSTSTVYMEYKDVVYNSAKYRGVLIKQYRQLDAASTTYASLSNFYEFETVYWFKYEPIRWKISDGITNGNATLISNIVLDSQYFDLTSVNFDESYIKTWLNSTFYNTAFSTEEKAMLVQNSIVSLPTSSTLDSLKTDLGATDYSIIQGLETIDSYYKNNWLTKSVNEKNQLLYYAYDKESKTNKLKAGASISYTSYGIVPTIEFNYCSAVGHTWIDNPLKDNSNRVSEATCTTSAVYYKVCSCCGTVSTTETFEYGEPLGHDYKVSCAGHAKCSRCSTETDYYSRSGDVIYFGSYPQSAADAQTNYDLTIVYNDPTTNSNWVSYGYYSNGNNDAAYMWYLDVQYTDGYKYRGVYLSKYRPTDCNKEASIYKGNTNQDSYSLESHIYWFKYEPIAWNIISENNGQAILAANLILDSQPYLNVATKESNNYYNKNSGVPSNTNANDYAYSSIRQWLNDTFYNTAFSAVEKDLINTTSVASNGYLTYDNVWIICSSDSYYSTFNSITHSYSDYSKIQGLYTVSIDLYSDKAYYMNRQYKSSSDGNILGVYSLTDTISKNISSTELGIVPIIRLNITTTHTYVDTVVDPTCTTEGYTLHECSVCGHKYKDNYVSALGHIGGTATCTTKATCTRCNHEYGEVLGHDYEDGICSREGCGHVDMDLVEASIASKGYALCGDTLYFGYYPQTIFTNTSIITELAKIVPTTPSTNWNYYSYYSNGTETQYMYYYDVTYGGCKYRAIYIDSFRPTSTESEATTKDNESDKNSSYQDNNGYTTKTVYWFKYEPIKWKVLYSKNGNLIVQSTLALDAQSYQNCIKQDTDNEYYVYDVTNNKFVTDGNGKIYSTNWENSSIRQWLNNSFYNVAFDTTQKAIIKEVTNDNSKTANQGSTSKYSAFQHETNDYVYIAAYSELIKGEYGYSDAAISDTNKQKTTTDYAKSQGIYVDNNLISWWGRSPNASSLEAIVVSSTGSVMTGSVANNTYLGVVPMLSLNLCAKNHDLINKITENNLKSEATCTSKAVYYKVCAHCGEQSETETFEYGEILPHTYVVVESKDATCTEDGYIKRKCSICNAEETEIIPALGHTGGTATCSEQATCSRCGEKYGNCLEHDLELVKVVDATCVDGYTVYKCKVCGTEIITNVVAGTGHTGGTATCTHKKVCTVCYKEYGELAGHDYSISITIANTCTEQGYTYKKCSVCGKVEMVKDADGEDTDEIKKYDITQPTGHAYIEKLTAPYLKTRATCTSCAVFYYACSHCGAKSTETYECSDPTNTSYYAKGHTYVNGVCTTCGDKLIKRVNSSNKEDLTGEFILFGEYPQTQVTDSQTLLALKKKAKLSDTFSETASQWTDSSDGYYKYIDIIYNGNKYRAIYLTANRSTNSESYSDQTSYKLNTIYWFKYEKIKWKILEQEDGTALLQSTITLDGQAFTSSSATYKYWEGSSIRSWLNGTFFNTAFNSSPITNDNSTNYPEQDAILLTTIDNRTTSSTGIATSGASMSSNNKNTTDKVYLLSYADCTLSSYKDACTFGSLSDYAKAQSTIENKYWTRSYSKLESSSDYISYVSLDNSSTTILDQTYEYILGVVPMIKIQLCEEHNYVNGRCSKCGDIIYYQDDDADGDYLLFGQYPQTKVTDTTLVGILNELYGIPTPISAPTNGWLTTGTQFDGEGNNLYYIDVTYLNDKYRGIYYNELKKTTLSGSESYVDDNGYSNQTVYWFKYEDIKWRVLTTDEGETLVYADIALEARAFDSTSSNWANSALNEWLNSDYFISTAFTLEDRKLLVNQFIDNKTTSYDSCMVNEANIRAYVSLLSYADLTTSSYRDLISLKKLKYSDYTAALGYYYTTTAGDSSAWLRSTSSDGKAYAYNFNTDSIVAKDTNNTSFAVIPVIKIQTCNHEYEYAAGTLICSKCRHIAYRQDAYTYGGVDYPAISIGTYATEIVTDSEILAKLNAMVVSPATNSTGWIVGRTFNNTAHLWYSDVVLGTNMYRAVYFDGYLPYRQDSTLAMSQETSYQDDNGYKVDTIYWFKYTTIEWRLAYTTTDDYYVLISNIALDVMYYADNAASEWELKNSDVYSWLISTMYNTLFSTAEQDVLQILNYVLTNKISLVDETSIKASTSISLQMSATDYAKCQGAQMEDGYTLWLTSTSTSSSVQFVTATGTTAGDQLDRIYSIVPIIMIKAN